MMNAVRNRSLEAVRQSAFIFKPMPLKEAAGSIVAVNTAGVQGPEALPPKSAIRAVQARI